MFTLQNFAILILVLAVVLMLSGWIYASPGCQQDDYDNPGAKTFFAGLLVFVIDAVLWLIFGIKTAVVSLL